MILTMTADVWNTCEIWHQSSFEEVTYEQQQLPRRGEIATVSRWYTAWFYIAVAPQFDFTPRVAPWHSLIWSNLPPDGTWHMVSCGDIGSCNRGGVERQQLRNQLKLCSFFNFSTSSLNISNSKERWSGFQDFGDAPKFQNWCLESLQNWMYTFPQLISSTSWRPFWPLECWPTQITSYSPTTTNWLWLHENTNMLKVLILGCGIKGHLKNFQKSNMVHTLPYPTRNWKTTTRWGLYSVYNTTPIQLQYIIGF